MKLLKNMLILNGVTDDNKKKMHIMGLIGMHAYTELCHAMDGKDIATLTSENLLEMLRDRYAPKKLVVAQRDKFLGVKQKPAQSLAELVAELQHVATACDFEKITSPKEARKAGIYASGIPPRAEIGKYAHPFASARRAEL